MKDQVIMIQGIQNLINEISSEKVSMESALTALRAWNIAHRVTTEEPNVIKYWKDEYKISGCIIK